MCYATIWDTTLVHLRPEGIMFNEDPAKVPPLGLQLSMSGSKFHRWDLVAIAAPNYIFIYVMFSLLGQKPWNRYCSCGKRGACRLHQLRHTQYNTSAGYSGGTTRRGMSQVAELTTKPVHVHHEGCAWSLLCMLFSRMKTRGIWWHLHTNWWFYAVVNTIYWLQSPRKAPRQCLHGKLMAEMSWVPH